MKLGNSKLFKSKEAKYRFKRFAIMQILYENSIEISDMSTVFGVPQAVVRHALSAHLYLSTFLTRNEIYYSYYQYYLPKAERLLRIYKDVNQNFSDGEVFKIKIDYDYVAEQLKNGKKAVDIAKSYNLTYKTFTCQLKKQTGKTTANIRAEINAPLRRKKTTIESHKLIADISECKSKDVIAKKWGVSTKVLSRIIETTFNKKYLQLKKELQQC